MLKHVLDIGWMSVRPSVRPSVCPSVTRWYCIKTAEHIVMLSPHDSPFILVSCISRSSRNSDGVTPCGAVKQRWGMKMSKFSTNNLLYLRKDRWVDGYMQRGVLQALNPLSNRSTFTAIVPGAYPVEAKMCLRLSFRSQMPPAAIRLKATTYRRDSREVAK